MVMELAQSQNDRDVGTFWRKFIAPQEDRSQPERWRGGYRWFRSENVVCIEHFRRPRLPGQTAGHFGWLSHGGHNNRRQAP
jgi:hypothetical protein